MSERIAGKLGRKPTTHRPQVYLHLFRTTAPTPPPLGNVSAGITDWGMLGNDTKSDCGIAMHKHGEMAQAVVTPGSQGSPPVFETGYVIPTTATALAEYSAYYVSQGLPPDTDDGVDNGYLFPWLYRTGQIGFYAQIDVSQPNFLDLFRQSMLDCLGVATGVELTDKDQAAFENGAYWSVANGEQPDPELGHDIELVEYATGLGGSVDALFQFVTWGALQGATAAWVQACVQDAWVFGSKEAFENAGYDYAAWQAAEALIEDPTGTLPPSPIAGAITAAVSSGDETLAPVSQDVTSEPVGAQEPSNDETPTDGSDTLIERAEVDFRVLRAKVHKVLDMAFQQVAVEEIVKELEALIAEYK